MLVVEDDRSCQILARRLLTSLGHNVEISGDAHKALNLLDRQSYDIIWMDIGLPSLGGLEATQLIRERYSTDQGPYIIAFTAHAFASDKSTFLQAGMDDYVSKPYMKEDLAGALSRYFEAARHQ